MQGASGADDKVHCSTSGFSIPTHQVIVRPGLLPFFVDMSSRRSENMGIVDCESFTPLVFSTFGGLGKEATIFYNRLADLLSQKHSTSYNQTLSWMRCALSFSLLCSAVLAIRGSRKLQSTELPAVSTELRLVESHILIDRTIVILFLCVVKHVLECKHNFLF